MKTPMWIKVINQLGEEVMWARMPLLADHLNHHRDKTRKIIRKFLEELDRFYIKEVRREYTIRFDDECEACGEVMDEGTHCNNKACPKAFPSIDLGWLMKKHPYGESETCDAYIKRVTQLWKDEK